ncbi:hypothetical protein MNY64_05155 [Moellerella wisconsensis]|uniref:hypothetical protein n=1 Tax=Moellerella wisconsensis TaxID=158849 RepID=UPI001F4EECA3|nr:hypothetical protein [Moellerella wisconsensis]UNH28198.1 hypothetical protein MNY64_05155 [Moellerella wisconsensis]
MDNKEQPSLPFLDDMQIKLSDEDSMAVGRASQHNKKQKLQQKKKNKFYVKKDSDVSEEQLDSIANQNIKDRIADRALREKFGDKAYNVVKKTLFGWAVVLIATAFCKLFFNVEIFSDTVLVAITSAVTLNTFAAFLGVIRGLFPSNRKYDGDENKGTVKD